MIGAVAVGLGVIGFVAANWEELSHGARLALLTVAVAGSYAAGFQLRDRTGSRPRVGEALYLIGVLLFGASLFLVGQMYNVEAHDPLALLLWAGGAVATALVVRSRAIAAAAVLIFTAWVGYEFGLALEDAGSDTWAAFPVVAVFYGGALYGLRDLRADTDPRALVREQRLPRGWPRRRAARRGGGALRLHLLRCDRRARARRRRGGRVPARRVRAPRACWRSPARMRSRSRGDRAAATRRACSSRWS